MSLSLMLPATGLADARLQAVMRRLEAGEAITIAALGGTATTGHAAEPPRDPGWAARLAHSLGPQARLIDAGLSGTDSAVAVQRLQAQVLDHAPDLVIVDFGIDDEGLDPAVRGSSYEAVLRRLLGAPKPPAVVVLGLTQPGHRPREATNLQLRLAAHYGLAALDFGHWMQARVDAGEDRWDALHDDAMHPNATGHERIALALTETLLAAARGPASAPRPLPEPLFGRAHEFTRLLMGDALQPYRQHGFARGGDVHPEWPGQAPGWASTADDGEAHFLVWGREVAVFHAQSEQLRNLEAWVDDGPAVTLRGHVPERRGDLGWLYTVVGRDLEPTAHLLHVRVKRDEWAGSGRSASLLALMSAGLMPPALRPNDFVREAPPGPGIAPDDPKLRWVGRIGHAPGGKRLAWSGSELRARFTGRQLGLAFAAMPGGTSWFTVEIDGRRHALGVPGGEASEWRLREPLAEGPHELRLVKRTEGSMAEVVFTGLRLAHGGRLLDPPPPRPLRLEFYGDSITAGACNGDVAEDQYEDPYSHDGTRAYGAVTAQRLGADYVGIAVSGIGITAAWHELLMPEVWDREAPRRDAAMAPPDARAPDVVLLNLGQNDHAFPASQGRSISPQFGMRYLAFVRQLRGRYPTAKLVLLIGGMSAPREQPALLQAVGQAVETLRSEGDTRVWGYRFEAFASAHPRIDVHERMADELTRFLKEAVLP